MIYMTSDDLHFIVLEPDNIEKLKDGKLIHSPDKQVAICYTPDLPWFQERLKKLIATDGSFDTEEFDKLHKESMSRREVVDRAKHPMIKREFRQ